jgi:hypothetical protein
LIKSLKAVVVDVGISLLAIAVNTNIAFTDWETDPKLIVWGNFNDEKLYQAGLAGDNFGTVCTRLIAD